MDNIGPHDDGWIVLVGQEWDRTWVRDRIYSAHLHVDPNRDTIEIVSIYKLVIGGNLLETNVSVILGLCTEALGAFHALSGNAGLQQVASQSNN